MQEATLALCALFLLETAAYARADDKTQQTFDIAPQALSTALTAFARQSHEEILFAPEIVASKHTEGVKGTMAPIVALRVLLRGSGLPFSNTPSGAVLVGNPASNTLQSTAPTGSPSDRSQTKEAGKNSSQDFRAAQMDQATPGAQTVEQNSIGKKKEKQPEQLEEVVVTGTHITGVTDIASPVSSYTRDDIDASGVGNVADFIRLLPDNFNGGASDLTLGSVSGGGNAQNNVSGTGINLRGLGSEATLVLINGRRVAPGNLYGNFVDVSMIPLAAVERVEVVPDGASAVYGSDAVGGVVNFIMRKDFDGAETRLRYGFADGLHDTEAAQTFGHFWGSGSAVLSYEYDDRTPLFARDRSYTDTFTEPTTLAPSQRRNSFFLNADQSASDKVQLFGNGYYSRREAESDITYIYGSNKWYADVSSYAGTMGAHAHVSDDFGVEVSGSYAGSRNDLDDVITPSGTSEINSKSSIWSADAKADGVLARLWAGAIRFAVGAEYRKETLNYLDVESKSTFNPERSVTAGYIELDVPLIAGATPDSPSPLTVSLAGRIEHYSDFGSTNNPKVGIIWRPWEGIKLRGSYGTSFKAPVLYDLNPAPAYVEALSNFDPTTGQNAKVLYPGGGGNPNLAPEKARSWTFGFDLQPKSLPDFHAGATYYNIVFRNLITNLEGTNINIFSALQMESILGPQIVQRHPPLSTVEQLLANPSFFDESGPDYGPTPGGLKPADITAILDGGYLNLSTERTSGIDFNLSYAPTVAFGKLNFGIDGTRILHFDNQFVPGVPTVSFLNTPYNPIDLRLRGHASWSWQGWTVAGFINYVNSYSDNRSQPVVPVASWTTGDLAASYTFSTGPRLVRGSSVQVSVTNVTNAAPPFVRPLYELYPVNYDGANASPIGRLVAIQLVGRW